VKPTRTTVGRPQEMLLYASRRCRSTTSVQCLSTFQLGGVHSIHHQIFESQLIIRHCFSFFLLKDAMISDGLGMADLCVGRRTFAMPPSTRRRGEQRTSTLVPSDAAGRGHAAMRQVFGPWSPPHSFFFLTTITASQLGRGRRSTVVGRGSWRQLLQTPTWDSLCRLRGHP